ncbi:hypothetical protein B0H13DRAFT_2389456 [Mycena leptocephala]|nr:hypothetical protein B0H13DRAFT_2389456 [Mycena leptocephala]
MVNTFLIAALAAGLVTALPLYRRDDSSEPLSVESLQNATLQACGSQTSGNLTVSSAGFLGGLFGDDTTVTIDCGANFTQTDTGDNGNSGQKNQENTSVFPALHTAAVAAEAAAGVDISASVAAASASAFAAAATAPPQNLSPEQQGQFAGLQVKQALDAQFGDTGAVNEDFDELSNLEFIASPPGFF